MGGGDVAGEDDERSDVAYDCSSCIGDMAESKDGGYQELYAPVYND